MNRIDNCFIRPGKKLMTHVVAGYPHKKECEELILGMAKSGADIIEIQFPFSDPMADGPSIMQVNQVVLDQGFSIQEGFELIARVRAKIEIPLLIMTYINLPYVYGLDKFFAQARAVGVDGLIIPDVPFDEGLGLEDYAEKYSLIFVPVVSPLMQEKRLELILARHQRGFIYSTLKIGITGAQNSIAPEGLEFLSYLKKLSCLPILAGFGLSSKQQAENVVKYCNGVIVGSKLINLYQESPQALFTFIQDLKFTN